MLGNKPVYEYIKTIFSFQHPNSGSEPIYYYGTEKNICPILITILAKPIILQSKIKILEKLSCKLGNYLREVGDQELSFNASGKLYP